MASFCEKCGFPQGGNSAFCPQCGSRVAVQAAPPPPPAGGGALKILAVLAVVLVVGCIAVVGGLWYVGHRVKQAVVQQANHYGVDLGAIPSPVSHGTSHPKTYKPCDILSKDDVERIIGQPIDHTETQEGACMYYGPKGLAEANARKNMQSTFKQAQVPGAKVDSSQMANAVDQLVNNLGVPGGNTGTNGEMPLIMLHVDPEGRPAFTAMMATKGIFSGIFNAADEGKGDLKFGGQIEGLGDKAVRLPKLVLNVLKGDTLISVIPGAFPDSDAKTIEIVRAVLPRL